MTPLPDRPVIHLGEVAGVAATLVGALNGAGVDAELRELPAPTPNSHLAVKALTMWPRLVAARRLRTEIRRRNAIAHVHYATSGLWFIGLHPLVIHCHGTDVRDPGSLQRRLLDRILPAADLILASTPDLLSWLPAGARYLPNPVDDRLFSPRVELRDAPRDVLVFAALTEVKGAAEILALVRALLELRPDTTVTAIAHGAYAAEFERAGVTMRGFMTPTELPALLNEHRIVLGQRLLGTPGTSELQALACGRPVVMPLGEYWSAPDVPPMVTARSPVSAARAVTELLAEPERLADLGAESRAWVVAEHGVEAVLARLRDLYAGL